MAIGCPPQRIRGKGALEDISIWLRLSHCIFPYHKKKYSNVNTTAQKYSRFSPSRMLYPIANKEGLWWVQDYSLLKNEGTHTTYHIPIPPIPHFTPSNLILHIFAEYTLCRIFIIVLYFYWIRNIGISDAVDIFVGALRFVEVDIAAVCHRCLGAPLVFKLDSYSIVFPYPLIVSNTF